MFGFAKKRGVITTFACFATKARITSIKCAPSKSNVPPTMVAVVGRLYNRGGVCNAYGYMCVCILYTYSTCVWNWVSEWAPLWGGSLWEVAATRVRRGRGRDLDEARCAARKGHILYDIFTQSITFAAFKLFSGCHSNHLWFNIISFLLRERFKKGGKVWSFTNPPPGMVFFPEKNWPPFFS